MPRNPSNNKYKKALDGRSNNGQKKGDNKLRAIEKELKGLSKDTAAKQNRNAVYATNGIKEVFGSEQDFWKHVAEESKGSFNHMKMLVEYAFGKPTDNAQPISSGKVDIPIINFFTGTPQKEIDNTIDLDTYEDTSDA